MKYSLLLAALLLAACSSKESAHGAFNSILRICHQDSFTYTVKVDEGVATYTANCKVKQ